MARKPNYDFLKRRKELDRKAEKDEKLRRRREKSVTEETEPVAEPSPGDGPAQDPPSPSDR